MPRTHRTAGSPEPEGPRAALKRRIVRVGVAALCLLAWFAPVPPQPAVAQDGSGSQSPEKLWKAYPLDPTPEPRAEPTAASSPAAVAGSDRRPTGTAATPTDGGAPVALLVILALFSAGGTLAFLGTRRRRQNEPQAATVPVASAPVVPPVWHAPLRSTGGATDIRSTDGEEADPVTSGPAAASPPDSHRAWTAEIEWRHTDAESRFCVIARAEQGASETAVAQSPPLEWPPTGPASVQALTDAAESLEASLVAARWKALPPGRAWYSKRFAWEPVASAAGAERAETEPVEPTSAPASTPVGASGGDRRSAFRPARSAAQRSGAQAAARGAEAEPGSDLHAADVGRLRQLRRVMSVSSAFGAARPVRRGKLPVATAVCVLVVAVAIAGLLLDGSFGGGGDGSAVRPPTAPQTIAHEGLRVQVPSGWARGDAATVPGFSRPLGLRNAGERLRATFERLPATSATLLPAAFVMTLKGAPERPDVVRLASGRQAWRYRFAQDDGSVTVLYAVPTTGGVVTVACMSPIGAGVPRGCEALASAITVPGSRPLEPGPRAAFYSRLPAAVSDLDVARAKGVRELSAATRSTGQAAAADGLARAHVAAGAALAPLTAEGDGLPATTVGALSATAAAYAALASAARARSPRAYADAGRAVTGANADLRRTMTKVAAAASAASRTAIQAASTRPAAATRPAKAKAKTPARTKPAASTSQSIDLQLPLAVLLGVFAIFLAVRETRRVLR
jgi:hypothetical protein